MKHEISTTITIQAPISTVWKEFFNFSEYPNWNPFIKSIKGDIILNQSFKAESGNMKFNPTVKVLKPNEEFSWLGKLFFTGLFDGRHSFIFHQNENGSTTLIQKESFSGILGGLMKKKLDSEIVDGFNAMNRALKERCENKL